MIHYCKENSYEVFLTGTNLIKLINLIKQYNRIYDRSGVTTLFLIEVICMIEIFLTGQTTVEEKHKLQPFISSFLRLLIYY